MTILKYSFVVLVTLALFAGTAVAQSSNASIVGDVTDPSGAAIPGATVTATHTGTGISREVQSNETGAFRIYPLGPGDYEVSASTDGFKTQVRPDIVLEQGSSLKVDFALEVGAVSESVEVTGEAPMMQTQEASVGGVVNNTQIERIPVNGRNYTRLMILMPGTSDIRRSQSRGTVSGTQLISVNGQRSQDNNFTLDGVDNNIMMQNSPAGSPPMDSIQEFRVATGNSAEYGRSAGANVNIAVKSGTRDLHGTAYWYVRNDKFDANPYFNNWENAQNGNEDLQKAPFKQNQFGVAFGGPIVIPKVYNGRDKTFWFVNYEGYRRRRGNTYRFSTPTAELRAGDFTNPDLGTIYDPLTGRLDADGNIVRDAFPGNKIPSDRINTASTSLLNSMMTMPNQPDLLIRNHIRQESLSNDRDMLTLRIDHTLSSKDTIFGRWMHQEVSQISPNTNPVRFSQNDFPVDNLALGWNRIITPSSVLEIKYAYNHPRNPNCGELHDGLTREGVLSAAGISLYHPTNLCNVVPNFNANGWYGIGGGGGTAIIDNNHQINGKMSHMVGNHSIRWGVGFTRRQMDGQWSNPSNGNMQFYSDQTNSNNAGGNSFASFLLGYPGQYTRGPDWPIGLFNQPAWEFFVQDDWRVTNKLTVNLGLRYEWKSFPEEADGQFGNILREFNEQTGETTATLMWAGVNPLTNPATGNVGDPPNQLGFGKNLMQNDRNDFAPRLGLAYQINNKTVIRAGIGIYYNSTFMQESQDMRKFWPYLPQQRISPNRGADMEFIITDAGPSFDSTQAIGGWPQESRKRTPYSSQWNLFIQRELMSNMSLEVGYVGSSNKKQIAYGAWNNAPTPSAEPLAPRRLLYSSGFSGNLVGGDNMYNSEYNAMQIKLNKRFSNGVQFLANYTYSNCMSDADSLSDWKHQDQFDRSGDWSLCNYAMRHSFKAGYVWDLPFGRGQQFGGNWNPALNAILGNWSVEGLVQLQTGAPSHLQLGKDWANVGWGMQRPDLLGDPQPDSWNRDPDGLFDTSKIAIPDRYSFGNAGAYVMMDQGRRIFDISFMKQFRIREGHSVEFRAEFFNFPNHFSLTNGKNHNVNSSSFGTTRSATTERQIQFALRYSF
jgi:carboxypeptidase family protein/TonB-dependent receptor-like protein